MLIWYNYLKQKYGNNVKPCYMNTDRVIVQMKTKDIFADLAEEVEKRFNTPNYEESLC